MKKVRISTLERLMVKYDITHYPNCDYAWRFIDGSLSFYCDSFEHLREFRDDYCLCFDMNRKSYPICENI